MTEGRGVEPGARLLRERPAQAGHLERFRRLGVGRITFDPLLQAALTEATRGMLGRQALIARRPSTRRVGGGGRCL
jgi:hypothetical protein